MKQISNMFTMIVFIILATQTLEGNSFWIFNESEMDLELVCDDR